MSKFKLPFNKVEKTPILQLKEDKKKKGGKRKASVKCKKEKKKETF